MHRKEIVYDRESRDYACYLDGELVSFARSYHEGEVTLDNLVFELMSGRYFARTGETSPRPIAAVPDGTPSDEYPDVPAGPCEPTYAAVNWNSAPIAGQAIARHFHRRPRHFIDTLRRLDPAIWQVLASAYVAYRGGTVDQTLTAWWLAVSETQHIPADYRADFVTHPIVQAADASAESYAGV